MTQSIFWKSQQQMLSRQHYEKKIQSQSSGKLWSSLVHDVCVWVCSVQWVCCCTQNVSILTLANFGWIISEGARGDRASKLKTHNKKGWNHRVHKVDGTAERRHGRTRVPAGSTVGILVIHVWLSTDSRCQQLEMTGTRHWAVPARAAGTTYPLNPFNFTVMLHFF